MRRRSGYLAGVIGLLIGASMLLGCGDEEGPLEPRTGVEFALAVAPSEVGRGEQALIIATVRNLGPERVLYAEAGCWFAFLSLEIRDPSGAVAAEAICPIAAPPQPTELDQRGLITKLPFETEGRQAGRYEVHSRFAFSKMDGTGEVRIDRTVPLTILEE